MTLDLLQELLMALRANEVDDYILTLLLEPLHRSG